LRIITGSEAKARQFEELAELFALPAEHVVSPSMEPYLNVSWFLDENPLDDLRAFLSHSRRKVNEKT